MNSRSSPYKRKQSFFSPQKRLLLKKEDKILLSIGGVFLIGVSAFFILATMIFGLNKKITINKCSNKDSQLNKHAIPDRLCTGK